MLVLILRYSVDSFCRSFAFMRSNNVSAKERPAAPSNISGAKKFIKLQFFLCPRPTERSPKPAEEIKLLQAGLGRTTVHIAEDAGHDEVITLVCGCALDRP